MSRRLSSKPCLNFLSASLMDHGVWGGLLVAIDVVRPSEISEPECAAWRGLQQLSKEFDSPFLSPDWALAVEAADGPASTARVAIFREDGRPRAFLPLAVPFHTARPLGGAMCDYQ